MTSVLRFASVCCRAAFCSSATIAAGMNLTFSFFLLVPLLLPDL